MSIIYTWLVKTLDNVLFSFALSFFFFFPCLKHLCLALMAWVPVCVRAQSVGVAQEARDHSYFRTPSVVNKVHPEVNADLLARNPSCRL